MKTEKCHLQFVLSIRGWILIACFLSVAACSFGAPSYTKQFVFEQGQKRLEIDVNQYCTYEIGISFASKRGDQSIKEFFGHARKINMPAMVDVSLLNDSGKSSFSIVDFGGTMRSYRYGPNPLKLIAGKVHLAPGKYTAVIDIKDIEKDFSDLESSFFVSGDPKVKCGKSL